MTPRSINLSVIVPFHRNLEYLRRCLTALSGAPRGTEILIAADGAVDDCRPLAARFGATVVEIAGPKGPAVARNRAAEVARGDVLVFIDADVVVAPGSLQRLHALFGSRPEVAAAFGAYDEEPAAGNFASQYKNLAHSYIHQVSSPVSQTFWAGFGAVRASVFAAVGGFDERFGRPCVEDIDLGYRMTAAGHLVLLDHGLRACHLKRWTVGSMIRSDVLDRGIPWTQLILKFGRFSNDLNLKSRYRTCVALSYALVGLLALSVVQPLLLVPAAAIVAALIGLAYRFYGYFVRQRGWLFTARLFPLHVLYHLYNGLSFVLGTMLFMAQRRLGVVLPGALPLTAWEPEQWSPLREAAPSVVMASADQPEVLGAAMSNVQI